MVRTCGQLRGGEKLTHVTEELSLSILGPHNKRTTRVGFKVRCLEGDWSRWRRNFHLLRGFSASPAPRLIGRRNQSSLPVHRCKDIKTLGPGHNGMCVAISFPPPATHFIHAACMGLRAEGEAGKLVLSPFGAGKTFLPGMIPVLTQ